MPAAPGSATEVTAMDTVTLSQILAQVDARTPNTWSLPDKLRWLSRVDGQAAREVMAAYENAPAVPVYTAAADLDTPLLLPTPWEECYIHFLEAQIHYCNGELTRYANAMSLYRAVFQSWADHYHRTHTPLSRGDFRGGGR